MFASESENSLDSETGSFIVLPKRKEGSSATLLVFSLFFFQDMFTPTFDKEPVFLVTFDFCNCHIPAGNRVELLAVACWADQLFQICLKGEAAVQALGNPGH